MMDCVPGLEYPTHSGAIDSSCTPRRTEDGLAVSEAEEDVAEKCVICHDPGWEDAMGGFLGTIGHAEDTPRLHSCCFFGVLQEAE